MSNAYHFWLDGLVPVFATALEQGLLNMSAYEAR